MQDRIEDWGVALVAQLARGTSPARAGPALGRAVYALGVRRRVCRDNLQRALGNELDAVRLEHVARGSYAHVATSCLEFLRLPGRAAAALRADVELTGQEHVRAALAAGRGAVVASGHLGNWEIAAAGCVAHGLPVTLVVQPLRNPRVDARVTGMRRGAGIELLPRGMALRRVRDALERNRLVFFMCDQDARRRGAFVPLFGTPASTPTGAMQTALRTGVPLLTALDTRVGAGRHRVEFGPPIPHPALPEPQAVLAMLVAFNARLEAAVRAAPEQYWWAHRRWKTRPPAAQPS